MDNKEYIYILDYSDCTICEIIHNSDDETDIEDILKQHGVNPDACSFMISPYKINTIVELTETL